MMSEKIKITAPKRGNRVEIVGLDEMFAYTVEREALIGQYERFTENVLLSCVMPEIPRYIVEHEEDMDGIKDAFDALQAVLVRYRKMTSWMRNNGIDVESVAGDSKGKTRS